MCEKSRANWKSEESNGRSVVLGPLDGLDVDALLDHVPERGELAETGNVVDDLRSKGGEEGKKGRKRRRPAGPRSRPPPQW